MLRSSKSKSGKKRLLPPSKTQFAWAMEQRGDAKTYFHTRAVDWEALGPNRAKIEAAEAEAAALAAAAQAAVAQGGSANPQAPNAAVCLPCSRRHQRAGWCVRRATWCSVPRSSRAHRPNRSRAKAIAKSATLSPVSKANLGKTMAH